MYTEKSHLRQLSIPGPSRLWQVAVPTELCIWQSINVYQLRFFKTALRRYFCTYSDLNAGVCVYLLTYSMEQSPSSEANRFSAFFYVDVMKGTFPPKNHRFLLQHPVYIYVCLCVCFASEKCSLIR
jgi:hypothetical protein